MRLIVVILAVLAASAELAMAQPDTRPEVITTGDTYNLAVGQATKLSFPQPFDRFELTSDTVVQVKPLTDRVVTLQGLAEGEAIMTVFVGGRELYSATVIVGAERGHAVKLYNGTSKDYTGYYCTDTSCGRADKELGGSRDPSMVSVTARRPAEGGGFNETTKTYGGGR
jgi:hypothetical protein